MQYLLIGTEDILIVQPRIHIRETEAFANISFDYISSYAEKSLNFFVIRTREMVLLGFRFLYKKSTLPILEELSCNADSLNRCTERGCRTGIRERSIAVSPSLSLHRHSNMITETTRTHWINLKVQLDHTQPAMKVKNSRVLRHPRA